MSEQHSHAKNHRPFPWTGLIVAAVIVASVLTAGLYLLGRGGDAGMFRVERMARSDGDALTPDPALAGYRIPPFELVDQSGAVVTEDVFFGRISVVDFMFTNCPFICPTLSAQMARLQEKLRNDDVQLVSFSVDPENDTPEALAAYAAGLGADPSRWTFLTGDAGEVQRISEQGLGLGVRPDPSNPIELGGGRKMENISHSSRFALIGPDGGLLALYSGLDPADVDRLAVRASRAASALRGR